MQAQDILDTRLWEKLFRVSPLLGTGGSKQEVQGLQKSACFRVPARRTAPLKCLRVSLLQIYLLFSPFTGQAEVTAFHL